jgi:putative ATP-dependent endonuclease of the OLD family
MKLTYFSIRDYRSIATAELNGLQTRAILVGPNNEGKSNVLRGLNACLSLLHSEVRSPATGVVRLRYSRENFDWASDYPVSKQSSHPTGRTIFQLSFQLSEAEKSAFYSQTGSKLNNVLPIELGFGDALYGSFKVLKQGKGGTKLSGKVSEICQFISNNLDFAYIPAIRTAGVSMEVVRDLVSRGLRDLEENQHYLKLQKEIVSLQKPILDEIADKLKATLKDFLGPSLRNVSIGLTNRSLARISGREAQVIIDDGTPTPLERKGDGVQSLAAISLLSGVLQKSKSDRDVILLIDEPESHLHPRAIHQVREVLEALGPNHQLIMATHCPLLVNRVNVESNFIVAKNKSAPAKSLSELREVLGVRASDNLQHAALVVVVEGPDDELALRALFPQYSASLKAAIDAGAMAFCIMGGATKLPYTLAQLQAALCNYYVLLDDDVAGRQGYKDAAKSLLISQENATFVSCLGLKEAELEDLFSESVYVDYFRQKYAVDVRHPPFNKKGKWSDRIRQGMEMSGKKVDGETWPAEYADKLAIAALVRANPANAINSAREAVLLSLVKALEVKLEQLARGGVA